MVIGRVVRALMPLCAAAAVAGASSALVGTWGPG